MPITNKAHYTAPACPNECPHCGASLMVTRAMYAMLGSVRRYCNFVDKDTEMYDYRRSPSMWKERKRCCVFKSYMYNQQRTLRCTQCNGIVTRLSCGSGGAVGRADQ